MGFMNRGFFTGLMIVLTTGVLIGALLPNMNWCVSFLEIALCDELIMTIFYPLNKNINNPGNRRSKTSTQTYSLWQNCTETPVKGTNTTSNECHSRAFYFILFYC